MSDSYNSAEKTEDKKNKTAGFTDLLLLSLSVDAYYKWLPNERVLVKQDMGAYIMIYPLEIITEDAEKLKNAFDEFIENNRFSESSRRIFRYFLFMVDDYSVYENAYAQILKDISGKCQKNGIIAEVDILDIKSGTLKTVEGKKMSEKKARTIIIDTVKRYKELQGMGVATEEVINDKKSEMRKKYEALGEVRNAGFLNPTILLIIINIAIFVFGYMTSLDTGEDLFKTLGIQDNVLIMQGEWWRLFTSMFLHADIAHLAGNMLFLFYLGKITIRYYSTAEFYAVYFLSGLCGNLLSFFLTDYRSLGASGAIMGLGGLVIYRMFFGESARLFRKSGNYLIFAVMIAFNLLYGVVAAEANIDNYGHFGGFIGGFLIALAISGIRRLIKNKRL
ncbi:MAG: rhomboid family intramembrane serine protease [Ruminococcaceae bacterium]|nr:rhomboid family intramembrane serine protease [Oscillospiraceae bacterium]